MLTTSGFSSTTTSKVGQIRRMPSCRWEGTATTVKRRGCKLKLRARLATGTVPVSAAKHSETLPNIKISKRFSGESAWSDSRKVHGRAKRRKRCFAPICTVPLVPALGLASIYRENATTSLSFHRSTESFYTSTAIRLPQPAYAKIRQPRKCQATGRRLAVPQTASNLQPPRPWSPR
jgi:hypothetical protein